MFIKKGCIVSICLVMFMTAVTGCIFGKEPLSSDSVLSACEQYDAEQYDTLDDMKTNIENDRALLAGMYISLEGENIKKGFTADKLGDIFKDAQEELLKNLYSKMIIKATVLIQAENKPDGGVNKIAAVAMDFEDTTNANRYYKALVRFLSDKYDDTSKDNDGDYSIYTVSEFKGKKAFCERIFMKDKHIMAVAGYEYKNNEVTGRLRSFCDIIGVEAPDISSYDCNDPANTDRFMELVSVCGADEIKERQFNNMIDKGESMCNYTVSKTGSILIERMDYLDYKSEQIAECRCLCSHKVKDDVLSGYYVYEIKASSVSDAAYMFDSLRDHFRTEYANADKIGEDTGDGIRSIRCEVNEGNRYCVYSAFFENDRVYVIGSYGQDSLTATGFFNETVNALDFK